MIRIYRIEYDHKQTAPDEPAWSSDKIAVHTFYEALSKANKKLTLQKEWTIRQIILLEQA